MAEHIVTVPEVMSEVRDQRSRDRIASLPYELHVVEPAPEDVAYTVRFAKETGDFRSLSVQDIKVIALAVRYVKEELPTIRLAAHPKALKRPVTDEEVAKHVPKPKKEEVAEPEVKLPTAWATVEREETEADPRFPRLDQIGKVKAVRIKTIEDVPKEKNDSEEVVPEEEYYDDSEFEEEFGDVDDDEPVHDVALDDAFVERDDQDASEPTSPSSEEELEANTSEEDKPEEDACTKPQEHRKEDVIRVTVDYRPPEKRAAPVADEEGFITVEKKRQKKKKQKGAFTEWITPENYKTQLKETVFQSSSRAYGVVCMTADFAMQNVLMQMGIRVASKDGMLVSRVLHWMLKCVICHERIFDMGRMFCPKCGYHDLRKISYYVTSNGSIKENFNPNKTLNPRGKRYNVTTPKGGADKGLVLTEDVYKQRVKMARRQCKRNGLSKVGAEKMVQIEHGRKNPNVAKHRFGKKNRPV